ASAASTGSPASRRSTKRTPLTTRPSLTSRHGMTRLANIIVTSAVRPVHSVGGVPWARRGSVRPRHLASFRQLLPGLGEVDHAGEEGTAHDAAYDTRDRGQPPQVGEPRDTARGDDRDPGRTRELRGRLDVGPLRRAVAADVRVEERGEVRGNVALIAERQGEFDRCQLGEINPPLHRHPTGTGATAAMIFATSAVWRGSPANAPSRSTTWSRSAPHCFQCTAIATGSSEKTVSRSARP